MAPGGSSIMNPSSSLAVSAFLEPPGDGHWVASGLGRGEAAKLPPQPSFPLTCRHSQTACWKGAHPTGVHTPFQPQSSPVEAFWTFSLAHHPLQTLLSQEGVSVLFESMWFPLN